jgi:hypothetical protein
LLRRDLLPQAQQVERRAGQGIDQLRKGVEEAARSVLGDDAESLRLARQQLDELIRQADGRSQRTEDGGQRADNRGQQAQEPQQRTQDGRQAAENGTERAQDSTSSSPQSAINNQQSQRGSARRDGGQPQGAESRQARGNRGNPRDNPQDRAGNPRVEGVPPSDREQDARDTQGDANPRGPFTDANYGPWSQRLRDVREMLPQQDLREQMARIWDSVRSIRADSKRHSKEPQWDVVQTQVVKPLNELRERVSERLAQLQSSEAMVPIDRDPVPDRFTELVRTYFENLGQGK